ncbi:selenium-binding family protein [Pseudonocardia kunmingensis]|uniref:Selenium-binding protein 1 n=1 Tax=Pseudonocardia kunmingensis TaxID=630975 RepID=A0A543DNZ8_9PSEU|nr:selenium-binding family protein [Pseudonocardia kunmingensis]TQM11060.1 selenium-binding protein 1 [Pseudonocardia kunmingensis]
MTESTTCCGPGYATPADATRAEPEKIGYTIALYTGTDVVEPDYLATVDLDPDSPTYSQVVHRLPMPNVGDELHHFGWNACSSCHGDPSRQRRFLIAGGQRSSRIHIIDTAEPRAPKIHKVIEPEEIIEKADLTAPHTVHCLADGNVMISMLGDGKGNGPGGFLLLDSNFDIVGRWENDSTGMEYGYDFWYQPRHNVMISSEWAAPNTYLGGFDLADVEAGKYGRRLHFWDWQNRNLVKSVDLGEDGAIPLEVRFQHDPASTHGYVGAALSTNMFHWHKPNGEWEVEKVIDVPPVEVEGWSFPVPGLMTDILVSMDDRYLYFVNWLHGSVNQYDITDPSKPRQAGQVWIGGLLGKADEVNGRPVAGAAQMIQLSLDGKRLYTTTSLFSSWDNQFYPEMAAQGSCMYKINCDVENGGMEIDEGFLVDFGKEPAGPARAHEMRYPGGDCSSDIWL